jgi:CBS domain-containing protein
MRIRDILATKGPDVVTVPPDATLREAMRHLVAHNIGAVVAVDDAGRIHGILSERDLLRTAADDPRRLETEHVADVMTRELITAAPEAEIRSVMQIMTERRIRHLPVVHREELVGIISIGDVVSALRRTVEEENEQLHAYIHGTTR